MSARWIRSYASDARRFYLYFVEAEAVERIKIGITLDVDRRVADLGCSSPVDLKFIGATRCAYWHERAVHAHFAHLRIRNEWFAATQELRSFAEALFATGSRSAEILDALERPTLDCDSLYSIGRAREARRANREIVEQRARAQRLISNLERLWLERAA